MKTKPEYHNKLTKEEEEEVMMPIIPAPEWEVTFKVKFKSDMFPGFGYDPMDIVEALKKDLEDGRVGHYVNSAEWSIDWFADKKESE